MPSTPLAALALVGLITSAISFACAGQDSAVASLPDSDAAALANFGRRVDEYAVLRRSLERTLPALTQTTEETIRAHQQALQQMIVTAREKALEGEVFVAEIRPLVRRICRGAFTGPDGDASMAEVREEGAELTFRAQVNGRYPNEAPLAWMPFRLLNALPPLPDELRYRFLGHDLILIDEDARVIVDVVRDALPR